MVSFYLYTYWKKLTAEAKMHRIRSQRMYKVKQFGSGSEPAGCLSKQQLSNQARFKAATAKKIHLQDPLQKNIYYKHFILQRMYNVTGFCVIIAKVIIIILN